MIFYTLGLILDTRRSERVQLKGMKGNKLTSCTEILERNKHLVNEYNSHRDEIDGTRNHGNTVDYNLANSDELEYKGIQEFPEEIFGYDVDKKTTKAEVNKLLSRSISNWNSVRDGERKAFNT